MKITKILGMALLVTIASGCGTKNTKGPKSAQAHGPVSASGDHINKAAQKKYETALDDMLRHDKKADWAPATCTSVAKEFLAAAEEQKKQDKNLPEAIYNAGLSYQRCALHDEAKAQFQAALAASPKFHWSKVQLALYDYRAKGDSLLDATIKKLHDAVIEARFRNLDALVNLAALQMKRNGPNHGTGCDNDMACAKLNIQRSLAINDAYMPAFNQLALYYLNRAKAKASKKSHRRRRLVAASVQADNLNGQMLDLAALVCSQAIRKNAKYGPIYNTLGLIQVEQKNINGAVKAFNVARSLDPNFFEAQMNFAAINLSFRGFDKAASAYRQAIKLRPDSYEAHLGLALAIRGLINDSNLDKNIAEAKAQLAKAKELAPSRPETYFNEGILVQEFEAKYATSESKKIQLLNKAKGIFDSFIQKAGSAPEYAPAVKNAKERKEDMVKIIAFIKEGQKAAANVKKNAGAKKKSTGTPKK